MNLVETQSLTKRYGDFRALEDCTVEVHRGEVFGLLGPNGAGKTTLIRLILGFLRPTSGTARVDGLDCFRDSVAVRHRVAYQPAEAKLFRRMRGRDVLQFFADVRGQGGDVGRSIQLAGRLDLDLNRRVAMMSTGMRQKLALAATMAHVSPLLILDEPTANLDPNVRAEVMTIVSELKGEGRTILLSSHVLSEVEGACDRVVILRQGRLVHTQSMHDLRRRHRITGCGKLSTPPPDHLAPRVVCRNTGDRLQLETQGDLADLLPWIASLNLTDVVIEPFGLRAVYEQYHGGVTSP